MYTLQNSKGEAITVDARFKDLQNGKVIGEDSFRKIMNSKYPGIKFRGMELMNANGDIATTGLAYQYATDRLTYIRSKIVEQTFYTVAPADFVDVIVGEGAWAGSIITNMTIKTAGSFSAGKVNTAGHNARLNVADASVAPFSTPTMPWATANEYSIIDVNMAMFGGNWDIVEMKHRSRKTMWDLGIQNIAFLGDPDDLVNFPGLYSQANVNSNLTAITKKISAMTYTEYDAFVQALIAAYLTNTNQTAWPDTFLIPQDDFAALGGAVSSQYPMISKIEWLQRMFDQIVPGKKVKIAPLAYGMAAYNKTTVNVGTGKARYILMKKNIDTAFMEIPVDFTVTAAGSYNNFNFQDVAYGQYSGVSALKPREILYFDY